MDHLDYEALKGDTPTLENGWMLVFMTWYGSNDLGTLPQQLGQWLGVSHRVGSSLCYCVLTKSGQVISSTTVQHITTEDICSPDIAAAIQTFNFVINHHLDDTTFISNDIPSVTPYIEDYSSLTDAQPLALTQLKTIVCFSF